MKEFIDQNQTASADFVEPGHLSVVIISNIPLYGYAVMLINFLLLGFFNLMH